MGTLEKLSNLIAVYSRHGGSLNDILGVNNVFTGKKITLTNDEKKELPELLETNYRLLACNYTNETSSHPHIFYFQKKEGVQQGSESEGVMPQLSNTTGTTGTTDTTDTTNNLPTHAVGGNVFKKGTHKKKIRKKR